MGFHTKHVQAQSIPMKGIYVHNTLKTKDLCGIPWRLAFALQADGWYLRADIIWAKPNPMPESVTDRPTKSHEYIFLLTKSGTSTYWTNERRSGPGVREKPAADYWWYPPAGEAGEPSETPIEGWQRRNAWQGHDYFFDQEAVRERATWERWGGQTTTKYNGQGTSKAEMVQRRSKGEIADRFDTSSRNVRSVWEIEQTVNPSWAERKAAGAIRGNLAPEGNVGAGTQRAVHGEGLSHDLGDPTRGRNIRSVWEITTQPFAEAHFAVFPEELVRRCLFAGTSERGCCSECGAPWEREVERESAPPEVFTNRAAPTDELINAGYRIGGEMRGGGQKLQAWRDVHPSTTLGWRSTCAHEHEPVPCVVLDPFVGSGTTMLVARDHRRQGIGIDLNRNYLELAARRLQQLSLFSLKPVEQAEPVHEDSAEPEAESEPESVAVGQISLFDLLAEPC